MKKDNFVTEIYKIGIYLVDILLVIGSIYGSYVIEFKLPIPTFNYQPFLEIAPFIILTYLVFMYIFGLSNSLKLSLAETVYSIFLTIIALTITTAFIAFFARGFSYPRGVLLLSPILQFFTLVVWRSCVWKIRRNTHGIKDSLIIGNESAEYVAKKILLKQRDLYRVKYICSSNSKKIFEFIEKVDVVFICSDVELEIKNKIVDNCVSDRKSLYIIPDMYEIAMLNTKLNTADDIPLLKVKKLGLTLEQKIGKRTLDIIFSIIGIVLASPIIIIAAICIKLEDGGTVFYKQERVTENEKKFNVLKFRTMVMNAEKLTGPTLAGENDPRISKTGKIMRSTRIDEIPQIFNILKGDMSLVGPRPERPFFVEKFKNEIPDYKYRTIVKAGLTGLAQVMGKYTTTADDKVRYDLLYIKNYSIFLDLKLIFQTIKIIFIKESSAGVKEDMDLHNILKQMSIDVTIDK